MLFNFVSKQTCMVSIEIVNGTSEVYDMSVRNMPLESPPFTPKPLGRTNTTKRTVSATAILYINVNSVYLRFPVMAECCPVNFIFIIHLETIHSIN
jgi:hypothetical protein